VEGVTNVPFLDSSGCSIVPQSEKEVGELHYGFNVEDIWLIGPVNPENSFLYTQSTPCIPLVLTDRSGPV
jgi:hypothetical protein